MYGSKDKLRWCFRQAIEEGDSTLLRILIRMYNVTATFKQLLKEEIFDGYTAIQKTCLSKNQKIAAMLLDNGCDLNDRGKHGWSAIHAASFAGCAKMVVLLLNSCADVLDKDVHGCLPIDLADDFQVKELLIREMHRRGERKLAKMYQRMIHLQLMSEEEHELYDTQEQNTQTDEDIPYIKEGFSVPESTGTQIDGDIPYLKEEFSGLESTETQTDNDVPFFKEGFGEESQNNKRDSGIVLDEGDIVDVSLV